MREFVITVMKKFNLKISKYSNFFSMDNCLRKCADRKIEVGTVIDVGASNGCWSKLCMRHFAESDYYLIEANPLHDNDLSAFMNRKSNVRFAIKAAGSNCGRTYFNYDKNDPDGGSLALKPNVNSIEVPVTTIDHEVFTQKLKAPYLIKLDTHGFEVPILEGAKDTLLNTNLLIIEAYNFRLNDNSLKFYELCMFLDKLGFYPIEIADLSSRLVDNCLWQMDIFFIKKDRIEFSNNSYR